MSVEAAVRARLEAELGRIFGRMVEAQEIANERDAMLAERDRTIAELREQLARSRDEIQEQEADP